MNVDPHGNIWLDQIMSTWARAQGLKEQQILGAVQANMFHEDGQLRFSIDAQDQDGRVKIRVLPKRDKWGHGGGGGTPRGGQHASWASWGNKQTPEKSQPKMRGSIISSMQAPKVGNTPTPVMNTTKKLDMPLDEVIASEKAAENEAAAEPYAMDDTHRTPSSLSFTRDRVNRSMAQMGLTTNSNHLRLPARGFGKGSKGSKGWGRGGGNNFHQQNRNRSPSPRHRNHRSISRSPTPADEEDEMLAETARRSLRVGERKPPPPPGEHWTKYEDDGTFWFYYEGPLGKWWSTNGSVEKYDDDED